MQEKMEREQKKQEEKRRKQEEKERKKRSKEQQLRSSMGLDNVVHLHEIDHSSGNARAQAQFIDNATAALFWTVNFVSWHEQYADSVKTLPFYVTKVIL